LCGARVRRRWGWTLYGDAVLNHVRKGRGEPLVLVHGIGSQWQMWGPVLDRLAAERDVVALDLPGFGESAALEGGAEHTVAALADAVSDFAASMGIERPHVAGNSLGGAIALELARTGRARSATGLSPIGFAAGRERPYAVAVLRGSVVLARSLGRALDAPQRTAVGRALTMGHLIGRPWRVPAEAAIRSTHTSPTRRGSTPRCPT
jgi:pimeloyl-ACP methyl ester carboxylesterase